MEASKLFQTVLHLISVVSIMIKNKVIPEDFQSIHEDL